jgi:hypothetical protein
MSRRKTGARSAQPKDAAARKAKDAERCRRKYWDNPEKVRERNRAKRQRRLEHYREVQRQRRRRNAERIRAKARELCHLYRQRHPERIAAHKAVEHAVRRGEIVIPTTCEVPGCSCTDGLAMHHSSYEPKDVLRVTGPEPQLHRGRGKQLRLKASAGCRWARAPSRGESISVTRPDLRGELAQCGRDCLVLFERGRRPPTWMIRKRYNLSGRSCLS